jgi:hypothetical protein
MLPSLRAGDTSDVISALSSGSMSEKGGPHEFGYLSAGRPRTKSGSSPSAAGTKYSLRNLHGSARYGLVTTVARNSFREEANECGLDLLTEVRTQRERAVIVQPLVTRPPHGIAHSLYLNLRSKF